MRFFFVPILLMSTFAHSQNYVTMPEATNTLPYDIRPGSGAAFINYNFDASMLMCGNSNLPSFAAISEIIKTFFIEEGITVRAFIAAATDESFEKSYVTNLLNEKNPNFLIVVNLFSAEYASVMAGENSFECEPEMEVGLFCSVQIAPYSKSETWFLEENPLYNLYKGSLSGLLSLLQEHVGGFKKQNNGIIEYEESLYKFGNIHYGLPENFSDSPLYLIEQQQTIIVGKPQGMLNKYVAKGFKTTNKMIVKNNQAIRELCANYKFNFEFVSQINANLFEQQSGYILKVMGSYIPISNLFENQKLLGASEKTDLTTLATFPCLTVRTEPGSGQCQYIAPPINYYYYLKDLKNGDIYLVNYDGYQGEEPVPNALKLFLDHISKG